MLPRPEGPDFVGVGVQKSGSTWLADILGQHPQVWIPQKEIHFFDRYFYRGYRWYHGWFLNKNDRLGGDFTPDYFISPSPQVMQKEFYPHWNFRRLLLYPSRKAHPPGRKKISFSSWGLLRIINFWFHPLSARDELKAHYPGIRVFAIFRNPVERAWSAYWDFRRRKDRHHRPFVSFEDLWANDGRWIRTHGLYAQYLTYWQQAFPDFGIFFYDDLKTNPRELAQKVYQFIGVDDTFAPQVDRWKNKGEYEPMTRLTRAKLVEFYHDEIEKFARLTGRDLSHWLKI